MYLGPLSSGPCKVVPGLGVLGLPLGVGALSRRLVFFRTTCSGGPTDDRSCRRCFCVLFFVFFVDDFFPRAGRARVQASASLSWAPSSRCVPHYFVDSFLGFSGLAALFLSSFWVGGAPLAVFFPAFSPWFLGGWVVCFWFSSLLCTLASCFFSVGLG